MNDGVPDPANVVPPEPLTTLQVLEILGRVFGPVELVAVIPRRPPAPAPHGPADVGQLFPIKERGQ